MTESMNGIVSELKKRAFILRLIANGAIAVTILVLFVGVYIFMIYSPKIAAIDIETHKKIAEESKDDITKLSKNLIELDNTAKSIIKKEDELGNTQELIKHDGNEDLHLPIIKAFKGIGVIIHKDMNMGSMSSLNNLKQSMIELNTKLQQDNAFDVYKNEQLEILKNYRSQIEEYRNNRRQNDIEYHTKKNLTTDPAITSNLKKEYYERENHYKNKINT